jgi:hypothetical protein
LEACKERAESICRHYGMVAGAAIGPKFPPMIGEKIGSITVGSAAYYACKEAYLRVCPRIAQEDVQECRTGECGSPLYSWCFLFSSSSSSSSEPGLGPPIEQREDDTNWDRHH